MIASDGCACIDRKIGSLDSFELELVLERRGGAHRKMKPASDAGNGLEKCVTPTLRNEDESEDDWYSVVLSPHIKASLD